VLQAIAARLIRVLACDPEQHLAFLIENTARNVLAASGETDVMHLLRRMKAEAALLIALCDIGGVWPVMQVTAALTDLAVASVQSALRYVLRQEAARGRLSPASLDSPEDNSGLIVLTGGSVLVHRGLIIALAAQHHLPAVYPFRYYVVAGGLISYGTSLTEQVRQGARYVDRIFKGAKPADLPVEQPERIKLVINLKTAQALAIKVPSELLVRADAVVR